MNSGSGDGSRFALRRRMRHLRFWQTRIILVPLTALWILGACKSDDKPPVASTPVPPTTPVAADAQRASVDATGASFQLGANETYYGGSITATNSVEWKVEDGSVVRLAIINTGADAEGRTKAVLRAYHDGATQDVQTYSLEALASWAELGVLPNGRARFRYGADGEGRRARNAILLRWDNDAKKVRLIKRWSGARADVEPAWIATGDYQVATESYSLCSKVVNRIVSCGKDAKFRTALFSRNDDAAAQEKEFDAQLKMWNSPASINDQCKRWASDEYVDTHFSDSSRLEQLAKDTASPCAFFAAEIVDDGGLPQAKKE